MKITEQQKTQLAEIAEKHQIKLMTVYGSQINGKTHANSDLDIGIFLKENPKSFQTLLAAQSELEKVFDNYRLDVRYLNSAKPFFLFEAVYKGKLLYGSNYDYAKLCAKSFKQFIDTKSLRDLRDKMIKNRQLKLLNKNYA